VLLGEWLPTFRKAAVPLNHHKLLIQQHNLTAQTTRSSGNSVLTEFTSQQS
jgi:hypothetical protein